jgi:hypothetical protein
MQEETNILSPKYVAFGFSYNFYFMICNEIFFLSFPKTVYHPTLLQVAVALC